MADILGDLGAPAPDYNTAVETNRRRAGLVAPGNIDLNSRPVVANPAAGPGGYSTVRSIGVQFDDGTYILPTVSDDGRLLTDRQAIDEFKRTGRHLGKLTDDQAAEGYGEALHLSQEQQYRGRAPR